MAVDGAPHSTSALHSTLPFRFPSPSLPPPPLTTSKFATVMVNTLEGWIMNMSQKTLQETPFLGMVSRKVLLRPSGIITERNFRRKCRHRLGWVWSLKEVHQVDVGVDDKLGKVE